jgi:hypothetical protein
MTISINYQKRKNINLFSKLQTNKNIAITKVQNYIPIYDRFFSLNATNWNSINLNHKLYLSDIKETKDKHILGKLKNIHMSEDEETCKVFIKMAPLLDPCKYLIGKYNHNDPTLFNLPSFDKSNKVHPKIADINNSSYVDGFFSFLTSTLLNQHNFIHGLDYYGSFLAIKNDYKINIIDDLDYLVQSSFFNSQKNILFKVEDYSHLIEDTNTTKVLKPINISTSLKSITSVASINQDMFENIFDNNSDNNNFVSLEDITDSNFFDLSEETKSETLKSSSSCSSRSSHTNDNDYDDIDDNDNDNDELTDKDMKDINDDKDTDINSDTSSFDTYYDDDDVVMLTIPKFPIQLICLEQCEATLDKLIMEDDMTEEQWFSALMQVIMTLITYQKTFSFTHNDLHTNNIMYITTNKKFIYYVYKKKTYKVPTFGRIFKIIDFGRAIYKYNDKIFCSDSFQTGGDAATQYNTEPFFNDKKPRLEPNFSFDLCRLACSVFDYVVDNFQNLKTLTETNSLVRIINEWCIDDNGVNILYKNNGVERYPDFKLYKMIARFVHNHTPQAQLERPEFRKYIITNKNIPKTETIINIDELPEKM